MGHAYQTFHSALPQNDREGGGIKLSNLGRIIFKISDQGRRANGGRSNMMYNVEGGGGRLLSVISSMVANSNNWKKELDLLYLLYLLKVILALDLFGEIHKSCLKFALPRSFYTFRFQVECFLNYIEFKFQWKRILLCNFLWIILVLNMENRHVV